MSEFTTNKLIGVVASLADSHGFLAPVIFKLEPIACRTFEGRPVETAATDGSRLLFSPDFAKKLTPKEIRGVVLHEIWHVAAGHPWRGKGLDANKANIAMDHEVNHIVNKSGETLPSDALCDPRFENWRFERIYRELFPEQDGDDPTPPPPPPPPPPGEENDEREPGEDGPVVSVPPDKKDDEEVEPKESEPKEGEGEGEPEEEEVEKPKWGEVWEAKDEEGNPLSEKECEDILANLSDDLRRGETHETQRGGGQENYGGNATLDRALNPRAAWTKVINQLVTRRGKQVGKTYRRPSRRGLVLDIPIASSIHKGLNEVVIAVDVSYSIDMKRLRAFFDHLDKLRKKVNIEKIHVLPFAGQAKGDDVVVVKPSQKLPRSFQIGGGTRFAPIFEWQRKHAKRAELVIVFTDMEDDRYGKAPKCPVIWASSEPINKYNRPPFGIALEIDLI
jgi:predicted metal-dependent peptidase